MIEFFGLSVDWAVGDKGQGATETIVWIHAHTRLSKEISFPCMMVIFGTSIAHSCQSQMLHWIGEFKTDEMWSVKNVRATVLPGLVDRPRADIPRLYLYASGIANE